MCNFNVDFGQFSGGYAQTNTLGRGYRAPPQTHLFRRLARDLRPSIVVLPPYKNAGYTPLRPIVTCYCVSHIA